MKPSNGQGLNQNDKMAIKSDRSLSLLPPKFKIKTMGKYLVVSVLILSGCAHSHLSEKSIENPAPKIEDGASALLKINFVPYRNSDNEILGYRLLENKSAKGVAAAGLQNMDVVFAVDQQQLLSDVDAAEAIQRVDQLNFQEIHILRGGKNMILKRP